MTPDAQTALTLTGNAGGRIPTTATCLSPVNVDECVSQSWLVGTTGIGFFVIEITEIESGGLYLMGTLGENALAAVLAPGN